MIQDFLIKKVFQGIMNFLPAWLNIKVLAIAVSILLATAIGSFVWGYKIRGQMNESATYQANLLVKNKEIERLTNLLALNEKITADLHKKKDKIRVVHRDVIKEVPVYVSENADCNLSVGAVGLLNSARSSGLPAAAFAADGSDERGRAASVTSQRTLVEADIELATRYHELKAKHEALVLWIRENLKQEGK